MNAPTAPRALTIPTTASTVTAAGATSATPLRIDTFIKSKLTEACSDGCSGLKSSAEAARSHGFTACANSRYADFLEAMSAAPDQVSYYAEKYPACFFLPWKALNATMNALNLWCDLPRHYTGAIPPGQLPYLDIFLLDSNDAVRHSELLHLINDGSLNLNFWRGILNEGHSFSNRLDDPFEREDEYYSIREGLAARHIFRSFRPDQRQALHDAVSDFRSSWFVVAPPAAFNVTEDWRARTRCLMVSATPKKEPPPDDPLVIRFVRHGCLVVAAWGEEAAELNATVNAINLPA